MDIRDVLSDGDLRSIGHVEAVVIFIGNDPERFKESMTGRPDAELRCDGESDTPSPGPASRALTVLVLATVSRNPTRSERALGPIDATDEADRGRGARDYPSAHRLDSH
ncbi:hypothetical protein [Exiguobacterium sp. AM39-5BH]|uniref:hypothetical protein n=1 Tax=Exiguobacterium sp. AM39-5BH TaxID=2292355 RepID=UPI000FE25675|nr:hypothetical protein [Exiguobacterium sp. AM39-5BH]RHB49716.1 hypothetical protein DW881_08030 [Exiguobacterium sp. AM39-5BH]